VAAIAAMRGYFEYRSLNVLRRFEKFQEVRRRFKESDEFRQICYLLDTDSPEISAIGFKAKRDFLGFFEEIALMHNSNLINDDVAHYMFGYYAIRCYDSPYFWSDVNKNSYYWSLFAKFVARMKTIESRVLNVEPDVTSYRF